MTIAIILGTRPEIMKNYAIIRALRETSVSHLVLHTNQHQDELMQHAHFELVGYQPDFVLAPPYSMGKAIDWVCRCIRQYNITTIVVNGDTAAALAGATAALYTDTPLAHVEAGLRSFDSTMIEERNRIMVDAVAHFLFTYTEYHAEYLHQNRELRGHIVNTGNTTVDLLADFAPYLINPHLGRYIYMTLHRKEFTDNPVRMEETFRTLNELAPLFDQIIFPMHPRTRECMHRYDISPSTTSRITVIEPVPFIQSFAYVKHAAVVVTDSGCIQEEAYLLGTPCVTLRENTERPETLASGANVVSGFMPDKIWGAVRQQAAKGHTIFPPIYGTVGVGHRIVDVLVGV